MGFKELDFKELDFKELDFKELEFIVGHPDIHCWTSRYSLLDISIFIVGHLDIHCWTSRYSLLDISIFIVGHPDIHCWTLGYFDLLGLGRLFRSIGIGHSQGDYSKETIRRSGTWYLNYGT